MTVSHTMPDTTEWKLPLINLRTKRGRYSLNIPVFCGLPSVSKAQCYCRTQRIKSHNFIFKIMVWLPADSHLYILSLKQKVTDLRKINKRKAVLFAGCHNLNVGWRQTEHVFFSPLCPSVTFQSFQTLLVSSSLFSDTHSMACGELH